MNSIICEPYWHPGHDVVIPEDRYSRACGGGRGGKDDQLAGHSLMPEDIHSLAYGGGRGGVDDQLPSHWVMPEDRHSLACGGGQGGEDDQIPSHDGVMPEYRHFLT